MKLCVYCKGSHTSKECPIWKKIQTQMNLNKRMKKDYFGDAPNIFVGTYNYPNVSVGILNTEEYQGNDDIPEWSSDPTISIQKVIDLRSALINSRFSANVKNFNMRFIDVFKEISLSKKPVDVEINLDKVPQFKLTVHQDLMPHGPSAKLVRAEITENPSIDTRIEKITADTDLKATDALEILHKKGFDEHYLTKIFSAGNLGLKNKRKLVPTRWSITAVDDILGKKIIEEIKDYEEINPTAFFGGFFGNYYLILIFPGPWFYDLFEVSLRNLTNKKNKEIEFAHDYESFEGRNEYAVETAGGYYAARFSILQKLKSLKKKGSVLTIRFITDEYWAPLGVWVVREAVKKTMSSKGIEFADNNLMIEYAHKLARKKFAYEIDYMLKKSPLLKFINNQKRLNMY